MTISGPGPIRYIEMAPSRQHLIVVPSAGDAQLWHIMSNSLVHTFRGGKYLQITYVQLAMVLVLDGQTNLYVDDAHKMMFDYKVHVYF